METYTVFLYPESGIEWVRGQGKNRNQQDAQAQVGFMSGEGESFLLPVSGLDQVQNIDKCECCQIFYFNVNDCPSWEHCRVG